jgi:tetratricopeptide (TPR) repeat protein
MRQDAYTNPVTDNFPWVAYAQVVAIYLDHLENTNLSNLQNNLATVLQDLGDYAGAKELLQKAFSIFQHQLGEDHPHTKIVQSNLDHLHNQMK